MFNVVLLNRRVALFGGQTKQQTHMYKECQAIVQLPSGRRRPPPHINKQMHSGRGAAAHDRLHQWDVRPHWRHEAGGSSCFHPNLVPHDYSQFHSRWFSTETDGGSQMPKYRWERSEVGGRKLKGEGWEASPLTPLHHRWLGYAPPWVWAAAGWWGMKGAAVDAAVGAEVHLRVDPPLAQWLPPTLHTPQNKSPNIP